MISCFALRNWDRKKYEMALIHPEDPTNTVVQRRMVYSEDRLSTSSPFSLLPSSFCSDPNDGNF